METASAVDVVMDVDSVSAARRRRERRLRQFLWHERLSVAMALSEKKQEVQGQGGGYVMHYTAKFRDNLLSPAGAFPVVRGRARRVLATLSG